MSGNRRKPYMVRKTAGWHYDEKKGKQVQDFILVGYAKTKAEGLRMLADFNNSPVSPDKVRCTFEEVYNLWSKEKYGSVTKSCANNYRASYSSCTYLHKMVFRDIKTEDLQYVIDTCGKNYPTLIKVRSLFSQLYRYAMKHDICNKSYASFVNVNQYKDRNPDSYNRRIFSNEELARLWELQNDRYYQIILMLIYNGLRVSEFLNLKKNDVHIDDQYINVRHSKTEAGLRKVPIADKVLPFYRSWYNFNPACEFLLCNKSGGHFTYKIYYQNYFVPLLEQLGMDQTPHCCRHTFVSMLAEAKVEPTLIKLMAGHKGAMSLTERVYTHIQISTLLEAINKI